MAAAAVVFVALALALGGSLAPGVMPVRADDGPGGRQKTTDVRITQYVWRLVSSTTGRAICEVIIDHEGNPTQEEAVVTCAQAIFPPERTETPEPDETPQPTSQPFDLDEFLRNSYWKFVEKRTFTQTITMAMPDILLNIKAPLGPVPEGYVLVSAYDPAVEYEITSIRGTINGDAFFCPGSPCRLVIDEDSQIEYWASSSFGDESGHESSFARVNVTETGYTINLATPAKLTYFEDSCLDIWGMNYTHPPVWGEFPISPDQLATNKKLHYLTGKLINAGLVKAQDCPGNGLLTGLAPNACGMERANQAMIEWQNQFDPIIWVSARDYGIPPRLIKTLIEMESQFWPGSSRYFVQEFGLGQINQLGADVALRWDDDLFRQVCNGLLYDCDTVYASLPTWLQATVRGALVRTINADCPNCPYGIDLVNARQGIPVIAQSLRSTCHQTKYLMDHYNLRANYEDMWRFSLATYHSGYQCLWDALYDVRVNREEANWKNVSARMNCKGTTDYVEGFWTSLLAFDTYRIQPEILEASAMKPTYLPSPTPTLTPTPVVARSQVRVLVFQDSNGNTQAEPGETINNLEVLANFADGSVVSRLTENGQVVFDMTGRGIGSKLIISVPALYRSYETQVLEMGEMFIIYRLDPPLLPTALP